MADDYFDSEGSQLYISLDGTTSIEFDCPTGMNNFGFSSTERERSCLNSLISTSTPGKRKLNTFQVPFRVARGSVAHKHIMGMTNPSNPSLTIPYAVGWTDGTATPTFTAGVYGRPGTGPAWTRTITTGDMKVSAVNWSHTEGDDVMGSFDAMPQTLDVLWMDEA